MEKERFILNEADPTIPDWKNLYLGSEIQSGELNSLLNPNWENSMDRNGPFESTLSSIVSSPAISNAAGNGISIGELIGKLGTFCNSGAGTEISPESHINSANSSRYNTPLSSPPKLNHHQDQNQIRGIFPIPPENHFPAFPHFPGGRGFAERAARLSCFGNENFTGLNPNHGLSESEKLSRVSSGKSLKLKLSQLGNPENKKGFADSDRKTGGTEAAELGESREESSISEQIPVGDLSPKDCSDRNARKRKSIPRGKMREIQISSKVDSKIAIENEESCAKRIKSDESSGNEKSKSSEPNGKCRTATEGNQKQSKENSKPSEPPKDYIHVRARRGQATDSHSLAERVRREKISERMKFLQDLVPGCNKVTGKAVMLDEIINYVQSLQRQVEFLSMKLATVNPSGELNMEALLSRDVLQSCGPLPHIVYPFDSSSYGLQSQVSLLSSISNGKETQFSIDSQIATMHRHPSMQLHPMNGFGEAASEVWENDLQSVVQMGTGQSQPQTFHDSGAAAKLKTEL